MNLNLEGAKMSQEKRNFIPKAPLAQSDYHHGRMGSSEKHGKSPEELHKPFHEYLDDTALMKWISDEIENVRKVYKQKDNTERWRDMYGLVRNDFLFPNLRYLYAIGRWPSGINKNIEAFEIELPDIEPTT